MPSKENSRKKRVHYPTAEEIFNKPPAPPGPIPPAWTDDSVASQMADERARAIVLGELNAMQGRPPTKKKPPPPTKEELRDQAVDTALSRIEQARIIQIKEYPELRWAVHGIIPEGCTFIAGPPKLGKSIFSLNI